MTCELPSKSLHWSEMLVEDGALARAGLHATLVGHDVPQHQTITLDLPDCLADLPGAVEQIVSAELTHLYLPTRWDDASFATLRAAVMAILSRDPDLKILFVGDVPAASQDDFARLVAAFGLSVSVMDVAIAGLDPQAQQEMNPAPSAVAADGIDAVLGILDGVADPEPFEQVEARLGHLQRAECAPDAELPDVLAGITATNASEREFLGGAAEALRAMMPMDGVVGGFALHLGAGVGLGVSSEHPGQLKIAPDAVKPPRAAKAVARVVMNIRSGKVLKHEQVSGIYADADAELKVAAREARVLGRDDRALWLTADGDATGVGAFLFNEAWQFLGVVFAEHSVIHRGRLVRVLQAMRTSVIWDDLVAMADLGCERSADALAALGGLGRGGVQRVSEDPVAQHRPEHVAIN